MYIAVAEARLALLKRTKPVPGSELVVVVLNV
jgi:hypothetical protein